ncbi:MAG: TatD family hydrolase [Candidatus Bathyarchaeota archaeon]|nr:TatD family hydrolase [Candidatus Bathyarchaeota archaeon]
MRRVIDSHVHLSSYENPEEIIRRAKEAGVDAIHAVGGDLESSKATLMLAETHPDYVFPGIGVHPAEVLKEDHDKACDYIDENAGKVVSISEIGLDYAYGFAKPKDVRGKMRELYVKLLDIAREHELPVSVHSRSAYKDSLKLLRKYGPPDAVFHWYDGPLTTLQEIIDAGYSVSATPALVYSKGHRAAVAETPIERILVETDSPVFLRNHERRSEPSDVHITIEALAELKGIQVEEVARVTTRNTETLFHIPS